MNSDATAAAPRGTGPGQAPFFSCAGCGNHKPMKGRTARHMHGLRAWVCSACSPKTKAAPAANTRRKPLNTDSRTHEPAADAADLERHARELVQRAAELHLVLTIEQVPLVPFAMGHHNTVVSVRPARGGA